MKAILLAGGFATRLWPVTEKRAKPLLILNNKEILTHIVSFIPENIDIIISTNKVFENDFNEWKKKNFPNRNIKIFIEDSIEDDKKIGALGATSLVINTFKIEEDIILIAGDNYFGFDFNKFIKSFKQNPIIACYDIREKERAKSFGVVVSKDLDRVDAFEEKPLNPSSTLVSTGCYIFPKKNLEDICHYSIEKNDDLGGVFEYLKKKGEIINIFLFKEEWFDIGSFLGYLDAHKLLQEKKYVEKGVSLKNVQLNDKVYIGASCKIEDSIIEDSIIFDGVKIKNSEIRNSIIDKNCVLENVSFSYKIIREGSYLVN